MKPAFSQRLPHRLASVQTTFAEYQVWDLMYAGRPARVLYTGERQTAQSGVAVDDNPRLLFDYNNAMYQLAQGVNARRTLIIGGGAFTLPMAIARAISNCEIDVVEIDAALLPIAEQYFGFAKTERLIPIIDDGAQYVAKCSKLYDLIVIDAFLATDMPAAMFARETVRSVAGCVGRDGCVAYNVIAAHEGPQSAGFRGLLHRLGECFESVIVYPAGHGLSLAVAQNLVVVCGDRLPNNIDSFFSQSRLDP